MKFLSRKIVAFTTFILFALSISKSVLAESQEMTTEKWKEDIQFLISTLESKHIHLYHSIPKQKVDIEVENLLSNLPEMADSEIFLSISKIVKSFDDSHTGLWREREYYTTYPVEFFVFGAGEIRVVRPPKEMPELMGAALLSIDGNSIKNWTDDVSKVAQVTDNAYSETDRLARYMRYDKLLKALGVAKNEGYADFEFFISDGSKQIFRLNAVAHADYSSSMDAPTKLNSPFSFEEALLGERYFWYQSIEETQTAYIYFSGYPQIWQMRRIAMEISRDIIEHDIKNIIIYLRDNTGGNFYIGLTLIKALSYIDIVDWKEGVYVLSGRKTYSAGMSNTAQSQELLNAKVVGEPTGANPNDFQDASRFRLPNSNWDVQYSKRKYRFHDTVTDGVIPDIYIEPKWEVISSQKDAPLNWVLSDIKSRSSKADSNE